MFFVLLLLWIIFNGKFTWEILIIGALVCVALYVFLWKFVDYSPKKELAFLKRIIKAIVYLFILIKEIIVANCNVIYYIYNAKLEVEPRIVYFKKKFKEEAHQTILADSITLTPGTITLRLDGDRYIVHCLDKEMGKGLDRSLFVKQLEKIEGGKKDE